MKIFNRLSNYFYYQLDKLKINFVLIRIDKFHYDIAHNRIMVIYKTGRNRLLQRMNILRFENEFFGRLSTYDKYRLAQFMTLQTIYDNLFKLGACRQEEYINYIRTKIKNEPLF